MISQTLERKSVKKSLATTLSSVAILTLLGLTTGCASVSNQSGTGKSDTAVKVAEPKATEAAVKTNTQVLRVGFISSDSKVPIGPEGWAMRSGMLKRELQGLGITDVKFLPFRGGPALNEALSSGSLEMGLYGDTPALVAKAAGIPTKLINQTRVGQNSWLLTREDGPSSVAELKGQKVGVAKGTYPHRYLLGLLDKTKIAKDVKVIQVLNTDAEIAVRRGDIAAYPFAMGTGPLLATKGLKVIDEAKNHKGLVGSGVSIITEEALAKNPNLPKQWNQIRQKALQEIKANPEAFFQFASEVSGGLPLPAVKESYPLSLYPQEPFTKEGLELLNSTKKFLADQKLLKSDFEIKDWQVTQP